MVARTWSSDGFFLGHRRLSIIDLSEGGMQPMATENGRLIITFNGEIYNYVELRDELRSKGYVFNTASDTEVLLHGYAAWGTGLPRHLVGMFAFAIADRLDGTLFLARDRFGEKPLLSSEDPHGVSFASELAPLAGPHDRALRRHSRFGRIPLFELRAWHPNPSEWRSSYTARNMEAVSCGRHHRFGPVLRSVREQRCAAPKPSKKC